MVGTESSISSARWQRRLRRSFTKGEIEGPVSASISSSEKLRMGLVQQFQNVADDRFADGLAEEADTQSGSALLDRFLHVGGQQGELCGG